MSITSMFFSKSVLDFIYMFGSNIVKKGFGFVREIILASVFGSSLFYANFLFLKTVSDLFSELSQGSALQASLLSKFSKLYTANDHVSLVQTFKFSQKIMFSLFILSQLIQIPIVFYMDSDYFWTLIVLSLLLGVILSVNFYNAIFLVVMQGKGQFKRHSISTTIDIFISTLVLYPFSLLLGVVGIAVSRLSGLLTLFYGFLFPMFYENKGKRVDFGIKDFNISLLLLGNLSNIIILISRFIAGLDEGNNITFFNYSVVLLNVVLTAVILNLNTIVLRKFSVKKETKLIVFSSFSAFVLGIFLVFVINVYGFDIIQFIFQRGAFSLDDTIATLAYAKDLSYSFILIFIASALFQPFFTLPQQYLENESKKLTIPFLISIALMIFLFQIFPSNAKVESLISMYSLSGVYLMVSLYSYIKYYRYVS